MGGSVRLDGLCLFLVKILALMLYPINNILHELITCKKQKQTHNEKNWEYRDGIKSIGGKIGMECDAYYVRVSKYVHNTLQ